MGTEEATLDSTPNGTVSSEAPSGLESKIIRQIEYYFGDYNLTKDRFLREQIKLDDGWIPLETMIKFNRLKSLTTKPDVILGALKKSSARLLQVSEDGKKIRRDPEKPLPENTPEHLGEVAERTVHVKTFPLTTSLDGLLDFFKDKGNIENIQMRRKYNSKKFKGSVFLTFATKEEAEKFLKMEDLKFKNNSLTIESKEAHSKRKLAERTERKEKRLKEKEAKLAKKESEEKEKSEEGSFDESSVLKGALLKITGIGQGTCWEDIKGVFNCHVPVAFVDYSRGLTEAFVRFEEEGGAKTALEKALSKAEDGKLTLHDTTVVVDVVEGEEELAYWKKLHKMKEQRRQRPHNKFQRGKGGRGRGRGGRPSHFGDRKRKEGEGSKARDSTEQSGSEQVQERVNSEQPDSAATTTGPEVKQSGDEPPGKKAKVKEEPGDVPSKAKEGPVDTPVTQKTKPDDNPVDAPQVKKIKTEPTKESPDVQVDKADARSRDD